MLLRLPTFFEPPWHTDEGIFAAVAQGVVSGGRLYADAWESKPPLFLGTYLLLRELFGAGVLPLRLAVTAAALGTAVAVFCIGCRLGGRGTGIGAAVLLAVLLGVPFWDGNLALTEAFVILPTALAVLTVLRQEERRGPSATGLILAGLLFGAAFLIRQTAVLAALAVLIWLALRGRPWLRSGLLLGAGAAAAVLPVVGGFAAFASFRWFWDANVGFFFDYVPSGRELSWHLRPLVTLPPLAAVAALATYRRRGEAPRWGLPALWFVFMLTAALITGRPYPHYLLPAFPPLTLLAALTAPHLRPSWRPRREHWPALSLALTVALLWLTVVRGEFGGNPLATQHTKAGYYLNFAGWALGLKSRAAYNDYLDRRVNLTLSLAAELRRLGARGEKLYVWGEYPWLYSLTGARPATRYMTSFYVLIIAYSDIDLGPTLAAADPRFIVMTDAWPWVDDPTGVMQRRDQNATRALDRLIVQRYERVAVIGRARIYRRTAERPVSPVLTSMEQPF